jgi:hypothetical protein
METQVAQRGRQGSCARRGATGLEPAVAGGRHSAAPGIDS